MKIIDYNSLKINERVISSGSFGRIYKCIYENNIYAYKEFKSPSFLKGRKRKLDQISKINEEFLITPKFWVQKNNNKVAYLTKLLNGKDLASIESYSLEYKIHILSIIKNEIMKMHSLGLIHADISSSNIIIENKTPYFVDFDNSSYNNIIMNISDSSDITQEFIKKYGIIKELDIFLFNLLTFEIINECNYNLIRKNIRLYNYGKFVSHEGKEICNGFFLNDNEPEKRFLIDTIK